MYIHYTWETEVGGKRQDAKSLPDIQIQIELKLSPSHRKQNKKTEVFDIVSV